MRFRAWGAGLALLFAAPFVAAQTRGLSAAPQVARAYDAILDARFDEVPQLLAAACGTARAAAREDRAPAEACQVLETMALWWRMRLDVNDRSLDQAFESQVDTALGATEAWVARDPNKAEAWFYLGASYGVRAQWRSVRGEQLAAARDGTRIKESLERAIALDPTMHDARYGAGLYQYYADVAPSAFKLLRWLLLLPGGDRVAGLRDMEQARTRAQVLRSEAAYQLHLVYLWYEKEPERALTLTRELRTRYPHNPHFFEIEADIHDLHRSDPGSSLQVWRSLFDAAQSDRVASSDAAAIRARLGLAVQLDRLGETDLAIDQLRSLLASSPATPVGMEARAHVALGQALDRMGVRDEAVAHYKLALTTVPLGDPFHTADGARDGLRRSSDATTAQAYRASLEGWRALERGELGDASRALARALALRPADPVTRYRQARLQLAERHAVEGIGGLESVISDPATPPHVFASACYHAARALEQQGSVPRAIELYRLVVGAFGADPVLKADAQRALLRLAA
jgi:tetratricopeptide (TPR) repeat protein